MTLALTKELIELNNSPVEGSNARAEGNAAPPLKYTLSLRLHTSQRDMKAMFQTGNGSCFWAHHAKQIRMKYEIDQSSC